MYETYIYIYIYIYIYLYIYISKSMHILIFAYDLNTFFCQHPIINIRCKKLKTFHVMCHLEREEHIENQQTRALIP